MKGMFKFGERKPRTKIGADKKNDAWHKRRGTTADLFRFCRKNSFRYNANSLGMLPKGASSFCVSIQNFDA